ncbi:MAG: type VI secretion system membrane subunit TssM, partial [Dokdonella sp.]
MLRWLFSLLFNRYVFIAIGLCALALAIWYLGPLFAFAQWRPLEPVPARLWLMGAIAFLLLLKWLAGVWRKHRINTRLIDSVMGLRDKSVPADDPSRAALEEMRANFAQALTQLKKARFGKQGGGWWAQFRQKYAYQIPWYVFIGAPGSGKTTALVNSGLRFPLAEELGGKESIRGVGGTRSCDWWFADEAVLLDTAGRFTTHESDAVADKAEWSGFLQLLRKFRPRQPLNGAILTISVWDLLSLSEDERKAHAALLRARLNELTDNLRIAFPIYVLVTKVDLLGGFNEYFENFSKEDRAQVWGVTLPLQPEQELTREALGKQLEQEMQSLARRLFDKLPDVMQEGHDTARRARAYTLPQHFSNLTPLVRQLVQNVFADSRFAPTAMLRGVYFTSGTQEGTPFDRLLGSLQNSLGLDASVALQSVPKTGKSFFLQDLLHKVVFPEAHLAGRNRRVERRDRILGVASHLGIALVLALVVLGWVTSYGKNTQYLQFVDIKTTMTSGYLKGQNSGE